VLVLAAIKESPSWIAFAIESAITIFVTPADCRPTSIVEIVTAFVPVASVCNACSAPTKYTAFAGLLWMASSVPVEAANVMAASSVALLDDDVVEQPTKAKAVMATIDTDTINFFI